MKDFSKIKFWQKMPEGQYKIIVDNLCDLIEEKTGNKIENRDGIIIRIEGNNRPMPKGFSIKNHTISYDPSKKDQGLIKSWFDELKNLPT